MDDEIIELDEAAVKELESAYGITPVAAEPTPAKAAPAAEAVAKSEPVAKASDNNDLLKRLQAAEERVAEERSKRFTAEKAAHDRDNALAFSKADVADAHYHTVANALSKTATDAASLKDAHRAALEAGDYAAAADTADKLAEAKAKLVQLQEGKAELDHRRAVARAEADTASRREAPKPDASSDPMDQFFASTRMPPKAQAWFRSHPECAPHNDRAAYYKALSVHEAIIKSGVADGSEDYYQKLDREMGYGPKEEVVDDPVTKAKGGDDVDVVEERAPKPAPKRVAAPVARDSVLQRRADGKVVLRLTAEQAQMADELGMSRASYAKQLAKAEQDGRLGGHNL